MPVRMGIRALLLLLFFSSQKKKSNYLERWIQNAIVKREREVNFSWENQMKNKMETNLTSISKEFPLILVTNKLLQATIVVHIFVSLSTRTCDLAGKRVLVEQGFLRIVSLWARAVTLRVRIINCVHIGVSLGENALTKGGRRGGEEI